MINGQTWPNPHLALTALGDKSEALVRDGVCSARQGQGLTCAEALQEDGLNIHSRQADAVLCHSAALLQGLGVIACRGAAAASINGVSHHRHVRPNMRRLSAPHIRSEMTECGEVKRPRSGGQLEHFPTSSRLNAVKYLQRGGGTRREALSKLALPG